jgi:hypothetical protein
MSGGEILTLGLGNYGTLAAAHWANSTTRFDQEQSVVYAEGNKGTKTVRLLLLDQAQPSRVRKVIPLQSTAQEQQQLPSDLHGEDADEENDECTNPDAFTWTWETATRHPGAASLEGNRNVHVDAERIDHDDDDEDGEGPEKRTELGEDDFNDELKGAPPQTFVPWWRYIAVPTTRRELLTTAYFDDPSGGLLAHSFGFGYHQSFNDSLFGEGQGRSNGRVSGLGQFGDRVRRSLEDSHQAQGVQLYVDGDSAFGGIACALLRHLKEDHEDIRATLAHTVFPKCDFGRDADFAKRRREEVVLNRALCLTHLADSAALFTPYEPSSWQLPQLHAFDTDDDVATAAIVAATTDTALYSARQKGTAPELYRSLGQTCGLLRSSEGLRITAAACAVPLFIPPVQRAAMRRDGPPANQSGEPSLWSVLTGSPLLATERWTSLTHAFAGPDAAQSESGAVIAHAFALRGVASLPDVEYPRNEAILRYAFPLRTSRFGADLYHESYPVSSSFPVDRLFGAPRVVNVPSLARASGGAKGMNETTGPELTEFKMGSHLVNTYQSAGYIREVLQAAEPVMRYAKHVHGDAYGFEDDEWREVIETLHALHDNYDHTGADAMGDDDDIGEDG